MKLFFLYYFFSERYNSGISCQYMGATGKLALHGNLRVHIESGCLNPGPNRAEICPHFKF